MIDNDESNGINCPSWRPRKTLFCQKCYYYQNSSIIKNSDFQRIHTEIVVLIIHFSTRNLALQKFTSFISEQIFQCLFLALKLIITPLLQCEFFSLALSFHFSFVMERYTQSVLQGTQLSEDQSQNSMIFLLSLIFVPQVPLKSDQLSLIF